jgi:uncharacterized membrane protein YoaK (UPF0700 family)
MAISSPLGRRQTVAALLTLTFVTGLVDAVSYLRLGHVFVANMTGNVVFLGFSADPRSGLSAAASVIAVGLLPYAGDGRFATIALLAAALGVQNSTVRHLGAPDLTTTVLTLTLTGVAADSTLAGGSGSRPHRRLGSVAVMLAGAAAGTGILQLSPTAVIALAAILVAAVSLIFLTATRAPASSAPTPAPARPAPIPALAGRT